jgi:hypothetical protein
MNLFKKTTSFIFAVTLITFLRCEPLSDETSSVWYAESYLPLKFQLGVSGITFVNSPLKNELIAVGGYNKIFEASNAEWNLATLPASTNSSLVRSISVNGQNQLLTAGHPPNVFYFRDNNNWQMISDPSLTPATYIGVWGNTDPISDEFFVIGNSKTEGPIVYRVTKNATVWKKEMEDQFKCLTINGIYGLGSGKFQQLYIVGDKATIITRKNGAYNRIDPKTLPVEEKVDFKAVWISEKDNHPVYVAGRFGTILKYEDGVWTKEVLPEYYNNIPTKRLSFYAIDGVGDEILAVGSNGMIFRKINGTWRTEAEYMASENLVSITHTVDPYLFYKTSFYVGGDLGTIFRSN